MTSFAPYTYDAEDIEAYMEQSTISFSGEDVIIDGKHYTDVWLSNEAAEKFRVNAYDIIGAWNIASQSNGTYVSGIGDINGVPIFNDSTNFISQVYLGENGTDYSVGDYTLNRSVRADGDNFHRYTAISYLNGNRIGATEGTATGNVNTAKRAVFQIKGTTVNDLKWNTNHSIQGDPSTTFSPALTGFHPELFDFDWVSGTIPADEELPSTDGLHLYMPNDPSEWNEPEVQDIINDYNFYLQENPDIVPDIDLDLDTPGLIDKIDDLINIIAPIINIQQPEFGPKGETPVPPVPGDTIANTLWSELATILRNIINKIDNVINGLTNIEIDLSTLPNLINTLPDLFERHVIDTIRRGLTGLKNIFLPILALLRNALGIWHYVVEWFQAISAPFTFYLGLFGSGYPAIMLPIYASIAGIIVIAVYRRFGR